MKTQIFSGKQIVQAADLLKEGKVVAFPTETVYGLGAIYAAAEQIYAIKGRSLDKPLCAHIARLAQVEELAEDIPKAFYLLAEQFLPGPLTLILKKKGRSGTIGFRFPAHPLALALIEEVGAPLLATSANLSGRPSPISAAQVLEQLEGKIDAVIDGGVCPIGVDSTVLDLVSMQFLRQGTLYKEVIICLNGSSADGRLGQGRTSLQLQGQRE